ncbi:hypothetical protein PO124_30550 [Bacillus licheniformis]|nr:hypothetical protein [Bacillus licheniformis]
MMIMDEMAAIFIRRRLRIYFCRKVVPSRTFWIFSKRIKGEEYQFIYETSSFTNWTTVGVLKRVNRFRSEGNPLVCALFY